ncbi:MAG: NAD-dependent epimerase/dehydratase family protein [Roseburia sp.]|nr:NAD-dependent epimerase/dehydratase family protein [Roseburia sp.]MCM1201636.1 NAD-dependent epimerase/dehydratase family protein [Bacteroides fragilis]
MEDIRYAAGLMLPWDKLQDARILITGAGGLIGSFAVDVLMEKNRRSGMNCTVYALGRNREAAEKRFSEYLESPFFHFLEHDINYPLDGRTDEDYDYIIHLASCTHPVAYAENPIATITTNVFGTDHLLRYAAKHHAKRFVFASSNEVYGENRGDVEFFTEAYCGYIDANTLRAGYPESKRCGEALCQAYLKEKGIDVVIPRFTRTYGPTMLMTDTKAVSQFIKKAVNGENIVLKSEGYQYYSYTYAADAVAGLFTVMLCGQCGEAYNIADGRSDIRLRDLAGIAAGLCKVEVDFDIPDAVERAGYSTATKARLDGGKIKALGWKMKYDIRTGVERTIGILREVSGI